MTFQHKLCILYKKITQTIIIKLVLFHAVRVLIIKVRVSLPHPKASSRRFPFF
jgi:hypothetical protein